ncbi:S-layer homology domain-containing protein [Paenibacillus sp. JX-17]|uniref:S-layer homology domain-containing protein n=1 Tax=Paenibacillus lacisoli TaxID=3064525 RepID=A0ABT9CBS2_9BACL|nr:S-layer homology domain-containing protein [Paenibacillus sp. JX-17]MDO7906705.1 S-layer homology domain-containing protein [Paenibacillus sp. JX-17]
MRKIIFTAAAALLLTPSAPSLAGADVSAKTSAAFSDLKDLDAATKAKFDAMIQAGIFNGLSEDHFGLQEEMNRAQFAKVAALIMGLPVNSSTSKSSSFKDVTADDPANGYALPYIEALKNAGITNGVGNGKYDPSGKVTMEQLAAFLVRSLDLKVKNDASVEGKISPWATQYVAAAIEKGLIDSPADTANWQGNANRNDLLLSSYEFKTQVDPLKLIQTTATDQHQLVLTFSASLDETRLDLSKILLNGRPLIQLKAHVQLSPNGKTLTVIFDEALPADILANPVLSIGGLQSVAGRVLQTDQPVKIENAHLLPAPPPVTPPAPTQNNPAPSLPPSSGGYTPPADTTAPKLLSVQRRGSESIVTLTFSEALDRSHAENAASYTLVGPYNQSYDLPPNSIISLSPDQKKVLVQLPAAFILDEIHYSVPSFFTRGQIQVSGITDTAGNVVSPAVVPVEAVNPGLGQTVSFVKPSASTGNLNTTQPRIGEHAEDIAFKYQISNQAIPAIIGLRYNSDENGSLGWNTGDDSDTLSEDVPVPVLSEGPAVITVISYHPGSGEVIGYQSFEISEDQVLRAFPSPELSEPITFTISDPVASQWSVSYNPLPEGHKYYYLTINKTADIGQKRSESFEWQDARELKSGEVTQLFLGTSPITVMETDSSDTILAYHVFEYPDVPKE